MWAECEPTGNLVVFHLISKTEIRQMCKMNVHVQAWRRVTRIISQCYKYVRHSSTFGLLFIFCTFYSRLCYEMSEPIPFWTIHSSHSTCICCNKYDSVIWIMLLLIRPLCIFRSIKIKPVLEHSYDCILALEYYIYLYYTGLNGSLMKSSCKLFIITLPEKIQTAFRCCGLSGDQ